MTDTTVNAPIANEEEEEEEQEDQSVNTTATTTAETPAEETAIALSPADKLAAIMARRAELSSELSIKPAGEIFENSGNEAHSTYTRLPGGTNIASTLAVNTSGLFIVTPGVGEGEQVDYTKSIKFNRKVGEELIEMNIATVGGYLLGNASVPTLSYKEKEGGKTVTVCQVIGKTTVCEDTGEEIAIRVLPNTPVGSMYKYQEKGSQDYLTPNPKLPGSFLGNRGETCRECISRGHSTVQRGDDTISCNSISYAYIWVDKVFVLTAAKIDGNGKPICKGSARKEDLVEKIIRDYSGKVKGQSFYHLTPYRVSELFNEDGDPLSPFILAIRITGSGNQGAWNQGLLSLPHAVGILSRIQPTKSIADFYCTITLVMKAKSATGGNYTQRSIPHFELYNEEGISLYSEGKGEPYTTLTPELREYVKYDPEKSLRALEEWMEVRRPDSKVVIDREALKEKAVSKAEASLSSADPDETEAINVGVVYEDDAPVTTGDYFGVDLS